MIERIVFMQGEEADEALKLLDDEGVGAAMDFLAQWHYPGEHETENEPAAGGSDNVEETEDGYILSWNTGMGYIGLEFNTEAL